MTVEIKPTGDGSKTLYSEKFGEHYHSTFGAVGESEHVFIRAGFMEVACNPVSVLEIGFGTGLNAYLTLSASKKDGRAVYYEAVELFPVDASIANQLSDEELFPRLHSAEWDKDIEIVPNFTLHKRKADLLDAGFTQKFDVVYFDAFSPSVQPEMWTRKVFTGIFHSMNPNSVLTTYCAKGEVRRMLQSTGFTVERLPGPQGKREILRARKTADSPVCSASPQ
jgi:tRNA U34 5-methylaminomethyl-2-thiouridine-forming methyltransferase MnmC